MKKYSLLFILSMVMVTGYGQRYFTKAGKIDFDATAPSSPEKIKGKNKTAVCVVDTKTGALQFSVLMKGFEFDRALMQEHFNENYVESEKFPKAEFKGTITGNEKINYSQEGKYDVEVRGTMTIHGEAKEVVTRGEMKVKEGKIKLEANFDLLLADYKISIPGLVADKVSKTAKIEVDCTLELFKN
jgi:polyisoprenoid-binding protein YceI